MEEKGGWQNNALRFFNVYKNNAEGVLDMRSHFVAYYHAGQPDAQGDCLRVQASTYSFHQADGEVQSQARGVMPDGRCFQGVSKNCLQVSQIR